MTAKKKLSLAVIGPGILVAATGVGAGDLATATFTGANLGTAILWAVIVGAALKYVLNEGLTRWQLATKTTILEGAMRKLGRPAQIVFMVYLIVWSYLVAMALMSACGVAMQAILPLFSDPSVGKIFYGIVQSLIAMALVVVGGYRLFEKIMSVCVGVMFVVVVITAIVLRPDVSSILSGLFLPTIPQLSSGGLGWTIALLGGVGGTVTVLCYGYWIREENRHSTDDLAACRVDLAVGYSITAVFGLAMVIIGSQLGQLDAKGAGLIIMVAETLEARLGDWGGVAKWAFLFGAWGAVFSSLLGVWQSVPYIFCDFWKLLAETDEVEHSKTDSSSAVYRWHLVALALLPISGLVLLDFSTAMKVNGMVGAVFIPMLAATLLILNGRVAWVGQQFKNSRLTTSILVLALCFSLAAGALQIWNALGLS